MTPHALALALLRIGRDSDAAALFQANALPHDHSLLSLIALALEARLRPLPTALPEGWPPWAPQLGPDPAIPLPPMDPTPTNVRTTTLKLSAGQKRQLAAFLVRMEGYYKNFELVVLMKEVGVALGYGLESPDLHLIGGLAAEEAGDAIRARVHLSTALALEPGQLIARTFLGRVYWRLGWNGLAIDLWRSLPVEGPDDYGRHYHLALGYDAEGRRADALFALQIALKDFYIETREFFIDRVYSRWLQSVKGDAAVPSQAGN